MKAKGKRRFKSDAEAADYFDRHSGEEVWKSSTPVKVVFQRPIKHMISIRMELELFEKIRKIAEARGLPYQTMMHQWLFERAEEELPSLPEPVLYASGFSVGATAKG